MEPLKPLAWYRELADSRKRRKHGFFLAEGPRVVEQIRTASHDAIVELLCAGDVAPTVSMQEYPVRLLSAKQFSTISSSKTPQGIAALVRIPPDSVLDRLPPSPGKKLVVLEGIQDPGNVGTLIRTAAALDFDGIVLSDACADPFSPKAVQASAGSVLSLWLRRTEHYMDLLKELKKRKYVLIAAELGGEPLQTSPRDSALAIMLGSEGNGLSEQLLCLADLRCAIPINRDRAESLNVAVSGGILMYGLGSRSKSAAH